ARQMAVPVVTTEFTETLKTVRNIYLVGEPFDVSVAVADRSGKPLARETTVILYRLEERGGATRCDAVGQTQKAAVTLHEVEVARQAVRTDAQGKGVATFKAPKGGQHRVRVEAKDRFGTVVTSELMLTISG